MGPVTNMTMYPRNVSIGYTFAYCGDHLNPYRKGSWRSMQLLFHVEPLVEWTYTSMVIIENFRSIFGSNTQGLMLKNNL